MSNSPVRPHLRAPLGGCDAYLLALEDLMLRSGQGHHVGVTVLELGAGFEPGRLAEAALAFGASQPILNARLHRGLPGTVPTWCQGSGAGVEVECHKNGTGWLEVAKSRLQGGWPGRLRFDVIPGGAGTIVLMSWSHLLLDARGVELALAEVARLGNDPAAVAEKDSHALPFARRRSWLAEFRAVRPFLRRYWSLREDRVICPGAAPARAGQACFDVVRFSREETSAMKRRAEPLTGGIFALPWFLAVTMRAHAAVFRVRGVDEGSLECTISAQGRKRGLGGPIFQNQVSQLFFALPLAGVTSLEEAVRALQEQFAAMTRERFDRAFIVMVDWMRRLPAPLYRRFLRREASGQLASFYHAHTGEFLPGVRKFCGGIVADGWHIPSVPQPPGTGLFFSEREGRLTASLCWRDGVISESERALMLESVRADLLGGS
ncbi:MAG: hypothetical protein ACO3L2_03405 [Chthoniobacterales bacterium]